MMESAAPKEAGVEEKCVKSEPSSEDVYIKSESSSDDACVHDEPLFLDACVKAEPLCSETCVKDEPPCPEAAGFRGVSAAAASAWLYADHVVKDELVLGPELVQPRRALGAAPGQSQQNEFSGRSKINQGAHCSYTATRKASLVNHEQKHSDKKPFECDHCGYITSEKELLRNHLSTHFSYNFYKCDQCSYASSKRHNLKVHETIHTDEKPYKCGHCSYASAWRSCLQVHESIHTDGKPYKCGHCSFASALRHQLKAHERIHTGKMPYKCRYCSFASARKTNLQLHERIHTGEKPYKCGQCSFASVHRKQLKAHERIHTGKKPYGFVSNPMKRLKDHERKRTDDQLVSDISAAAAASRPPAARADSGARHRESREPAPGPRDTSPDAMTTGFSKQVQPSTPVPQYTDDMCKPQNQTNIQNPFSCIICKRQFPTQHTLNVHQDTHEHECHHCKITFGSKTLLLKHECPICEICKRSRGNDHNCPKVSLKCVDKIETKRDFATDQKVHIQKIYVHCPTCCKQFTYETDLINHVNKMKFPCIYCSTCCATIEELSEHSIVHRRKLQRT